jgi:hypothetical protein
MAASQRGVQPCKILYGVLVQQQCRLYGIDFFRDCSQKNDCHAMLSAFLSPIGECPIDPEEADEELDADQVHKKWKEYYKHQKKEMEREHKLALRCLEKSREEISKVRNRLTSESQDLMANALREARNPERLDAQTYKQYDG